MADAKGLSGEDESKLTKGKIQNGGEDRMSEVTACR